MLEPRSDGRAGRGAGAIVAVRPPLGWSGPGWGSALTWSPSAPKPHWSLLSRLKPREVGFREQFSVPAGPTPSLMIVLRNVGTTVPSPVHVPAFAHAPVDGVTGDGRARHRQRPDRGRSLVVEPTAIDPPSPDPVTRSRRSSMTGQSEHRTRATRRRSPPALRDDPGESSRARRGVGEVAGDRCRADAGGVAR